LSLLISAGCSLPVNRSGEARLDEVMATAGSRFDARQPIDGVRLDDMGREVNGGTFDKLSVDPFKIIRQGRRRSLAGLYRRPDGTWHQETEDDPAVSHIKTQYERGEAAFNAGRYDESAKYFKAIADGYKDAPIREDALFYLGESHYRLERFPKSMAAFKALAKDFPNSRFAPQAVERMYDVSYFWFSDSRAKAAGKEPNSPFSTRSINLFDRRYPLTSKEGHALELVKAIYMLEPAGSLTDDALMMAGGHHFATASRELDYVQAAAYYEDLVTDQQRSEFYDKALFLMAEARARAYRGPSFDGQDLTFAKQYAQQALRRGKLNDEQMAMLKRQIARCDDESARRDFDVAGKYVRMNRRNAARHVYRRVIQKFPDTEWSTKAKIELESLGPEEPEQRGYVKRTLDGLKSRITGEPIDDLPAPPGGGVWSRTASTNGVDAPKIDVKLAEAIEAAPPPPTIDEPIMPAVTPKLGAPQNP
jgi:tetratricopeptide (TPR) repeat protein